MTCWSVEEGREGEGREREGEEEGGDGGKDFNQSTFISECMCHDGHLHGETQRSLVPSLRPLAPSVNQI